MRTAPQLLKAYQMKKFGRAPTKLAASLENSLLFDDVYGLRPFITLSDFELDILTFIEGFESVSVYCAVMNKDITAALFFYKTVTFRIIKPFDLP